MIHLIGNSQAKSYLQRMTRQGFIGHSLLFAGPEGIGKGLFALELAKVLLDSSKVENHPDLHLYRPEGKLAMHSMQTLREFRREALMPPNEASRKIFIIHEADRMLSYSANALLKTLEEPPADTLIILLTSRKEALLPTILSRCRTLFFSPISEQEIVHYLEHTCGKNTEESQRLAIQARGSIGRALRLAQEGADLKRELLLHNLSHGKFRHYADIVQFASELAEVLEKQRKQLIEAAQSHTAEISSQDLTSTQREALEKEVEGTAGLAFFHEVDCLLEDLWGWFRDLHLLQIGGDQKTLFHRDHVEALVAAQGQYPLPSLDKLQSTLAKTRLAISRHTKLSTAFEALFLEL